MTILELDPTEHFAGFLPEEGLAAPSFFLCPVCEYGIYFTFDSLRRGAGSRWTDAPRHSNLRPEVAYLFAAPVEEFLTGDRSRFVLDFHCPKCQTPFALGFDWSELHMGDRRYFPRALWRIG